MGNLPKISKWRTNGDPGITVSGLEERVNDINGCGKTGKNTKNDDSHGSPPGVLLAPLLPGKPSIR
jgi:hypothetical protein